MNVNWILICFSIVARKTLLEYIYATNFKFNLMLSYLKQLQHLDCEILGIETIFT